MHRVTLRNSVCDYLANSGRFRELPGFAGKVLNFLTIYGRPGFSRRQAQSPVALPSYLRFLHPVKKPGKNSFRSPMAGQAQP